MPTPQLLLPSFPNISLSFLVNTQVLLVVLVLFFILYAIISLVLFYHWSEYGMRSGGILLTETLFSLVSVVLFTIAGLAIYYY